MDCPDILVNRHMKGHDYLRDILHSFRKRLDMDLYIYYLYKPCLLHNLNLRHIPVCTLYMDPHNILGDRNMNQFRVFLYKKR